MSTSIQDNLLASPPSDPPREQQPQEPQFSILGVQFTNVTRKRGIELVEQLLRRHDDRGHAVYFANAHTLNLAAADAGYRAALNAADHVFADGTGVRWAARLQAVRVQENLVGTDFTPALLRETAGRGYSYYLLGGDAWTIQGAAEYARRHFPGWTLRGYHHGFLADARVNAAVVEQIRSVRPELLLVGMGNPLQESWIHRHRDWLPGTVCMGIGGLFNYWMGNLPRAPRWLRRLGHEWLWLLCQQPRDKARRYLLGNPAFLGRVFRERLIHR
jgi:N-acetylglucosaminyldiphosphoundecaprenol N-acetyl-beta-D-mannosaminyltransferase